MMLLIIINGPECQMCIRQLLQHACTQSLYIPCTILRLAETFEYHGLVDKAASVPGNDSTTRMMLVAVWQLSCYNSQVITTEPKYSKYGPKESCNIYR